MAQSAPFCQISEATSPTEPLGRNPSGLAVITEVGKGGSNHFWACALAALIIWLAHCPMWLNLDYFLRATVESSDNPDISSFGRTRRACPQMHLDVHTFARVWGVKRLKPNPCAIWFPALLGLQLSMVLDDKSSSLKQQQPLFRWDYIHPSHSHTTYQTSRTSVVCLPFYEPQLLQKDNQVCVEVEERLRLTSESTAKREMC